MIEPNKTLVFITCWITIATWTICFLYIQTQAAVIVGILAPIATLTSAASISYGKHTNEKNTPDTNNNTSSSSV